MQIIVAKEMCQLQMCWFALPATRRQVRLKPTEFGLLEMAKRKTVALFVGEKNDNLRYVEQSLQESNTSQPGSENLGQLQNVGKFFP